MADSTSLEDAARQADRSAPACKSGFTWQRALILMILFLLVVSDYFVNNFVSLFPKATQGREVTNSGAVVQGVCLVLLYALTTKLAAMRVI